MSDYVHMECIRYKIDENIINGFLDTWGSFIESDFIKAYKLDEPCFEGFKINYGYNYETRESEYYLDMVLVDQYGEVSGDWTKSRYLTSKEAKLYYPAFKKTKLKINVEDLRYVDFCYYNGADAPACYDTDENIPEELTGGISKKDLASILKCSAEGSIWTEQHINELFENFKIYPKED